MNLAIDLDGVIAKLEHGRAAEHPNIEWFDGAEEGLPIFALRGHRLVVHSCRTTWPEGGGWQAIARLLAQGGLNPFLVNTDGRWDEAPPAMMATREDRDLLEEARGSRLKVGIWNGRGKPIAHRYIDDRALTFDTWDHLLNRAELL